MRRWHLSKDIQAGRVSCARVWRTVTWEEQQSPQKPHHSPTAQSHDLWVILICSFPLHIQSITTFCQLHLQTWSQPLPTISLDWLIFTLESIFHKAARLIFWKHVTSFHFLKHIFQGHPSSLALNPDSSSWQRCPGSPLFSTWLPSSLVHHFICCIPVPRSFQPQTSNSLLGLP